VFVAKQLLLVALRKVRHDPKAFTDVPVRWNVQGRFYEVYNYSTDAWISVLEAISYLELEAYFHYSEPCILLGVLNLMR